MVYAVPATTLKLYTGGVVARSDEPETAPPLRLKVAPPPPPPPPQPVSVNTRIKKDNENNDFIDFIPNPNC